MATFFGKRTSEDGEINWDWSKERIRNWVRAQSQPYPGAFTFFNDEKLIIDEVKYHNVGFNQIDCNGSILKTKPIVVKTANGGLELSKIRCTIKVIKGEKLGR